MEGLGHWELCDELTVIQAALLILGEDPTRTQDHILEQPSIIDSPSGFDATFAALTQAINGGRLPATIRRQAWERGWDEDPQGDEQMGRDGRNQEIIYKPYPDWGMTTITVRNLQAWLVTRGITTGFFFPRSANSDAPDYLNPSNRRYAPKLAAAVRAWQATSDESLLIGKTPKQALTKWLLEHAAEFQMIDSDGRRNETGIEEAAKVANWQRSGGAPKTPGG